MSKTVIQQLFDDFEKANGDLAAVMQLVMNKENYLKLERNQIEDAFVCALFEPEGSTLTAVKYYNKTFKP